MSHFKATLEISVGEFCNAAFFDKLSVCYRRRRSSLGRWPRCSFLGDLAIFSKRKLNVFFKTGSLKGLVVMLLNCALTAIQTVCFETIYSLTDFKSNNHIHISWGWDGLGWWPLVIFYRVWVWLLACSVVSRYINVLSRFMLVKPYIKHRYFCCSLIGIHCGCFFGA